jgi:transposase
METGTHSPWVSRLAEESGHETFVANPSELYGPKRRKRRNDKLDAEKLGRLGRADPALLYPIQHRGESAQADLAVLRSRDHLVKVRTQLVNHVRDSVKSIGERLPKCDTDVFARRIREALPPLLRPALEPVVEQIAAVTEAIDGFDQMIEWELEQKYPETDRLRQVKGVGPLTAMAYVLVLEDPKRFPRVREVGSHVGLVPRLDDTGQSQPQLRITKAGDELLRRYWLVPEVCWHSSVVASRMAALRLLGIALLFRRRRALPCGRHDALDAQHTSVTTSSTGCLSDPERARGLRDHASHSRAKLLLNPVAIFGAVMFRGWLWGIPGAILAVPLLTGAGYLVRAPATPSSRPLSPGPVAPA